MDLLAGPYGALIKVGGIVIVLGLIFGTGYYQGVQHVQTRWDASITQQATRTANQVVAEAENTAKVETQYIDVKGKTETKLKTVYKEVVKYVEIEKPCVVGPEFVRTFDATSGVLDADADGVPAADPSAAKPDQLPETDLTSAEVLQAYYRAVEELAGLWDEYHALVQWVHGSYIVQQSSYKETP